MVEFSDLIKTNDKVEAYKYTTEDGRYTHVSSAVIIPGPVKQILDAIGQFKNPNISYGFGRTIGNYPYGLSVDIRQDNLTGLIKIKIGGALFRVGGEVEAVYDPATSSVDFTKGFAGVREIRGEHGQVLGFAWGAAGDAKAGLYFGPDGISVGASLDVKIGVVLGDIAIKEEVRQTVLTSSELDELISHALTLFEDDDDQTDERCFSAGTLIDMADGTQKPIEAIEVGDEVLSYDPEASGGLGDLKAARVSRTMTNLVDEIIDFHGVGVTPGHATLCAEARLRVSMCR